MEAGDIVTYHERGFRVARVVSLGRKWVHLESPTGQAFKLKADRVRPYQPVRTEA